MARGKSKSGTRSSLTEIEKKYIRDNHGNTTVIQMSAHLKRAYATIYKFMEDETLTVFSSRPEFGQKRKPHKVPEGCFDIHSMQLF